MGFGGECFPGEAIALRWSARALWGCHTRGACGGATIGRGGAGCGGAACGGAIISRDCGAGF